MNFGRGFPESEFPK